ncbi:unnamed protein product [Caenorhabditis bovis]|uniref:MRG domain-containing protein n=1 Tax=Caenorhabditis bovis TaxID=2654633 RepID=A0A8S1EKD9_9PELO|nr:unnamed protein product [Caenorhabditis bovis]
MPKAKPHYDVGTQILCMHEGLKYEAKILDVRDPDGADPVYLVHYHGWNSRYDEHIKRSEIPGKIFEATPEAIEEALAERARVSDEKTRKKKKNRLDNVTDDDVRQSETGSRGSSPSTNSIKTKGLKRKAQDSPAVAAANKPAPGEMLKLPKELRQILVDDNDLVNKSFLAKLPARHSVDSIVQDYIKTLNLKPEEMENIDEMYVEYDNNSQKVSAGGLACSALGLVDYFNVLLNYQLLYKFERAQYQEIMESDKASQEKPRKAKRSAAAADVPDDDFKPSKYYGIAHLLRLLSRLPTILKLTPWDQRLLQTVDKAFFDFVVYLNKNASKYFDPELDYIVAPTEYYRNAHQQ